MVRGSSRNSSRYFKYTLGITAIAVCSAVVYIITSFTETRQIHSVQIPNVYPSSPEKLTEDNCTPVCNSKECVYAAKELQDFMKPDVDPCENFYEFVCGETSKNFGPEKSKTFFNHYNDLIRVKQKNTIEAIEADPESTSGKIKTIYDSCMRYNSSEFKAVPTILEFIHKLGIPGWPILDSAFKFVDTSLTRVIVNFSVYQEYSFIDFSNEYNFLYDGKGSKEKLDVTYEEGAYEKYETDARKYIVDRIMSYFNVDLGTIEKIWEDSEAIHYAIKNLREESRRKTENYTDGSSSYFIPINCTRDIHSKWNDLCECVDLLIEFTESNDMVKKECASTVHYTFYYVQNIFSLLRNFSDWSLANYLAINAILNNLNELNFYFRITSPIQDSVLEYQHISNIKWSKCVKWISDHMTVALGHEYVKKELTVSMLQDVESLIEECIREADNLFSRQEWMTDEGKKKMGNLDEMVGNNLNTLITRLPNETIVNKLYKQFHPTDENYFQNVLEYKKCFKIMEMQGLTSIWTSKWFQFLFHPLAFGGGRGVDIQLGYLLPPAYLPGHQRVMNLATLGITILHELGHFLQYYFKFYLKEKYPQEFSHYEDNLKCLEEQYSQFRFETIGENLNGSRYVNENFADAFAISVIDKIFQKYTSDDSAFPLPSLRYSLMQQMYIHSMHTWCAVHTKEMDEIYNSDASHSPNRFRVLGMMQNSKGFSKAFGCPAGSFMNPLTKCLFLD